jgi:hypothetical protein
MGQFRACACLVLLVPLLGSCASSSGAGSDFLGTNTVPCDREFHIGKVELVVEKLLLAAGKNPPRFSSTEYDIRISQHHRGYLYSASRKDLLAVHPFLVSIDLCGRVLSFPQCCDLGHCPKLCAGNE